MKIDQFRESENVEDRRGLKQAPREPTPDEKKQTGDANLKRYYDVKGTSPKEEGSYYRATISPYMRKAQEGENPAYLGVSSDYPDRLSQRDPNPSEYTYMNEYGPKRLGKRRYAAGGMVHKRNDKGYRRLK